MLQKLLVLQLLLLGHRHPTAYTPKLKNKLETHTHNNSHQGKLIPQRQLHRECKLVFQMTNFLMQSIIISKINWILIRIIKENIPD